MRGRGARRFFDSAPRVSQPGDGLLAVVLSQARSSASTSSSEGGEGAFACVRASETAPDNNVRRLLRPTSDIFIGDLGVRTRLSRAKERVGEEGDGEERQDEQALAAKMRKARDVRDRQVTRSR